MTRLQGALDADFINIKETPETVNLEVQMKKPNDVQGTVDAALSSGRQYGEAVGGTLFTSTKRAAVSVATGAKESVIDAPKVAAHQAQEAVANVSHIASTNLKATKATFANTIHRAQETATIATDRLSDTARSVVTGASDVLSFATGASNGSAPWTSIPTPWSATDTRGLLPSLYENTVSTTASVFRGARDVAEVLAATLGGAAFAIAALSKRLATLPLEAGSGAASTALGMLVASTKGVGHYSSQLRLTTREAYTDGWQRTQAALQGAESRLVDVGNRTTTQVANIAHSSADKVYSLQQLGADKAGQLVDKAKGTIGSVVEGGKEVAGVAASTAYQAAGTVEGYAEGALHAANDTIKAGVGSAKHALENTVGPPAASAVSTLARGFEQGRGAVASVVHGAAETAAAVTPDHVPSVGEVGCATKRATKEGIDAAAATAKKGVDVVLGPVSNC